MTRPRFTAESFWPQIGDCLVHWDFEGRDVIAYHVTDRDESIRWHFPDNWYDGRFESMISAEDARDAINWLISDDY